MNMPQGERPQRRLLSGLVVAVLAAHVALLWGMSGSLDWRLPTTEKMRVEPLQTRWIPPEALPAPAVAAPTKPRTRLATLPLAPAPAKPVLAEAAGEQPSEALEPKETQAAPSPRSESEKSTEPPPEVTPTTPTAETALSTDPALSAVPAPQTPPAASTALPPIPLGALPPSVLLSYRMTGQEKGMNYYANGELRWQHNEAAYALSLSVKAFLVGTRHWRSVGEITEAGLAPRRFSDSWRNERAAHFDRAHQRVVFSNNAPSTQLGAGAQDQISLYVQLAAAMAGAPQRFEPGTRLQIQTVTTNDALPWLLTLGPTETFQLNGLAVTTVKWVCQPRNRFDATVEFWVSAQHAWMPVRIRITQVSGSFIDLMLSGQQALPPLPAQPLPS
jgi:hypothetical protein